MPKKSALASVADEHAAPGGAAAVDRAVALLAAFQAGDGALSLTELAARTRLYKSTALRLLASLAHGGLLRRTEDGRWALGPQIPRLAAIREAGFALADVLLPGMRALVHHTQESVAFHVRQGDHRLVLQRVDSPQLLRDHVRVGDVLPLNRGAGGRLLLAFGGAQGPEHAAIRQAGYVLCVGDRVPGLAGVSAPVWDAAGTLVGALTLTAPEARLQAGFVEAVVASAASLSKALGHGG